MDHKLSTWLGILHRCGCSDYHIVVFYSPADGKRLIKRVIGLPGDEIALRDNRLYINGNVLGYSIDDQDAWRLLIGVCFIKFRRRHAQTIFGRPVFAKLCRGMHGRRSLSIPCGYIKKEHYLNIEYFVIREMNDYVSSIRSIEEIVCVSPRLIKRTLTLESFWKEKEYWN